MNIDDKESGDNAGPYEPGREQCLASCNRPPWPVMNRRLCFQGRIGVIPVLGCASRRIGMNDSRGPNES